MRARASRRKPRPRHGRGRAERLALGEVEIPGDFSSAAPLLVAATLLAGSELTIHGVNLNPRRTGLLDVLERMGAHVSVYNRRRIGGEPVGDLEVRSAELVGDDRQRDGGAAARRRAAALRAARRACATATASSAARRSCARRRPTGSRRWSTALRRARGAHPRDRRTASRSAACRRGRAAATIDARGDHRIAMLGAVAGLVSREGVAFEGAECGGDKLPRLLRAAGKLACEAFR